MNLCVPKDPQPPFRLSSMKIKNKWICGPGGLRCPCCRCGSLKDAKRGFNRSERRKNKQTIQIEE